MIETRLGGALCHECALVLRQFRHGGQPSPAALLAASPPGRARTFSIDRTAQVWRRPVPPIHGAGRRNGPSYMTTARVCAEVKPSTKHDLASFHARILELTATVLASEDRELPSEQRVLYALEHLEALAKGLIDVKPPAGIRQQRKKPDATATSALLGSVNARRQANVATKESLLSLIGAKAEEILRQPNVFITPAVLKAYVELKRLLHQPASFPDIFELYAGKPIPHMRNDGSVDYKAVSPTKPNAAIDSKTANEALTSAMAVHSLPLCIDIITTTFATVAFKRAKIIRQAVLPLTIVGLAPAAAYTLSSQFALLQTTVDPGYATGVAFAGIMTYVATVCSLGYVVVTTANDQMDRVTWAKGVPLWERWIREEERAALDRVAGQWGFQSRDRRGEEEGADWEALREYIGLRGMVLDRVELMEGME